MPRVAPKKPRNRGRAEHAIIYWTDAVFHLEGRPKCEVARTYGEIVAEDADSVTIAGEAFAYGSTRQHTTIPKGMIRRIVKLKHIQPEWFVRATPENIDE